MSKNTLTTVDFETFIKEGTAAKFRTTAELKTLAERCRSEIATLRAKPAATVAPTTASKTAPAASKPAAAVSTARTLTAAEWQAQNAPPTMSRAEWNKLGHIEKGQFFQKGGKLAP